MKIYNLVSGKLWKNVWLRRVLHLSLGYDHGILVSGYLVVTAVNWPWNGSLISNCKDVSCMHTLTQVDFIFFVPLRRLTNILRDYIRARNVVMWHWSAGFLRQLSIDINIMAEVVIFLVRHLHRRRRWRQYAPASYIADHVDHEKKPLGFHIFYAWFSSVSPISISMGLRSPAPRAGEALL